MKQRNAMLHSAALAAGLLTLASCASASAVQQKAVLDFSTCAKPAWPAADLQAKHTGTVTLGFNVTEAGSVADSRIVKSSGHAGLDEAARTGIAKCRFKPATQNGKAIAADVKVQYVWTLE